MNRARTKKAKNSSVRSGWKSAALALGFSLGIGAVFILLAALAASFTPDPGRLIFPLAVAAAGLTYLFAGMIAAKLRPDAPLAAGAVNGLILAAISLALSLLFRKRATVFPAYVTALLHAGMILLSLLGAYLYVLKKRKQPRRKKRKHG